MRARLGTAAQVSDDLKEMLVKNGYNVLLGANAEVRIICADGAVFDVEYDDSLRVGSRDVMLIAKDKDTFPHSAAFVEPNRMPVIAVKADGSQVQVSTSLPTSRSLARWARNLLSLASLSIASLALSRSLARSKGS